MSAESRNQAEGMLRWVAASAQNTWSTASAPTSGLVGFVQSFTYTSARQIRTVMERGVPHHHKETQRDAIQVSFSFLWTGLNAVPSVSAALATVPAWHLEFKSQAKELGATSGYYMQFHGVVLQSNQFTEAADGNTIQLTLPALAMNGPTASGYLG